MKIQKSTALVTGANRGIGKAFVEALLAQGASKVYATGRKLEDLAAIVALDPKRVVPLALDVTVDEQVKAAVAHAKDVTLLINNAGALSSGGILDVSESDARRDMDVNYHGLVRVTRSFAPVIHKNGGGVIANVLSIVSLVAMPGIGAYNASKAAAWSATQALRAELVPQKIHVLGIYPGPIDTDMAKGIDMAKTPPSDVATDVLAAIESGVDDVFPDPMSKQVYAAWKADHKAVEKQFANG